MLVAEGGSGTAGLPVGRGITTSLSVTPGRAGVLSRKQYLALAEQGVAKTSLWWDGKLQWYRAYLDDHQKRPLLSLWDSISMFELLDEVAIAQPTAGNRTAVKSFAAYYQNYWNPDLEPTPAYEPYPGERSKNQHTWYDDNGWLGLAFLDADAATGTSHYLPDAERAMAFIEDGGWDVEHGGGMWWDTQHTWLSGEALGADTDLAARLYQVTRKTEYRRLADTWIAWANKHLRTRTGVYIPTSSIPYRLLTYKRGYTPPGEEQGIRLPKACRPQDGQVPACLLRLCNAHKAPCTAGNHAIFRGQGPQARAANAKPKSVLMPHDGEGAMLAAMVTLYQTTHHRFWLAEAETFAGNIIKWLEPFDDGPQYDGILLRGFVTLYAQDHRVRWYKFLTAMASIILDTARTAPGVYLKPWGGGSVRSIPGAAPRMLRTDASSLMVFADLATVSAPK